MTNNHQDNLEKFIAFCQQHITGQERKEAQIFLDRFFQAFGYDGALEAGAKYEEAIKKGSKKKNTGFADLVWKPKLLIEMKKRGEDLSKHYAQAFEYWSRLVPDRPRYVILCNFDQFWIFDFNLQLDEPVDIVKIEDLCHRQSAFNFMMRGDVKSIFKNNQVDVTEKAGRRLGELFQILQQRLNFCSSTPNSGVNRPPTPNSGGVIHEKVPTLGDLGANNPLNSGGVIHEKVSTLGDLGANNPLNSGDLGANQTLKIQRFILQCVLAMFAQDRGLLPDSLFLRCVEECLEGASSYDILGGLFREMNNIGVTPAGKYQGVEYFNGGLFATVEAIELTKPELEILETVAKQDWSKIRPAIFGNIFEGTVNEQQRHSYGIHYTSEADIMKIVRPTISKYWEDLIDSANTIKDLTNLQLKLQEYKVLDPACGSGNFLYVAYQELKRIEQLLLDKIKSKTKGKNQQINISFVTPNQFYGMDINPFAVELAKVTLMIARKVAIDKFNLTEPALPLDSLDNNIICCDALFTDWVKADAIIGNPPFLGGKQIRQEFGDNYAEKIYQQFKQVKGQPDFCVYWFRKSHDNLAKNTRVGLVATNSISQNVGRNASLDYIVNNHGYIYEAFAHQKWSGDAAVYVNIVNWCYEKPTEYYLNHQLVKQINSSLTNSVDVTQAQKLNKNLAFKGVSPCGKGFIISEKEAQKWISQNGIYQKVIKPFLDAKDLARNPHGKPSRWIIDFNNLTLEEASNYPLVFERIKNTIPEERKNNRNEKLKVNWWQYEGNRLNMRDAIESLSFYFAIPRVSKWFIFLPVQSDILPSDLTVIVASDDFYILGILTSNIHRLWVKAQSSTLGETLRYTNTTCFETFPFPQLKNAPFSGVLDSLNNGNDIQDDTKMVGDAHPTKKEVNTIKKVSNVGVNRPPAPNSGGVIHEKVPTLGDLGANNPLNSGDLGANNPLNSGDLGANNRLNSDNLEADKIVQQIRDKMIELHNYRTEQMERKQWGITQLYNAFFHEPSSKLYQLHQQLDKLVMKAYNFEENEDILEQLLKLNLAISDK